MNKGYIEIEYVIKGLLRLNGQISDSFDLFYKVKNLSFFE